MLLSSWAFSGFEKSATSPYRQKETITPSRHLKSNMSCKDSLQQNSSGIGFDKTTAMYTFSTIVIEVTCN